jgi:hypothetical protein
MFYGMMKFIVLTFALASAAETWTISNELVQSKIGKAKLDRVTFKSDSASVVYEPKEPPLGMVSSKAFVLGGETYFVTGWAHGPSTILFRVFAPGMAKEKPVCELSSLSESAELRELEGKIQIALTIEEGGVKTWQDCSKRK